jgi:hypothetical protein
VFNSCNENVHRYLHSRLEKIAKKLASMTFENGEKKDGGKYE